MKTMVLIAGAPASGKTSIARQLADTLPHARHIEADAVIGHFDPRSTSYKLQRTALLSAVAASSPSYETVIVDDCFHLKSMRKPLKRMAGELGRMLVSVWVRVEQTATLLGRDRKRERPVGDVSILKIVGTFNAFSHGEALVVDGCDPIAMSIARILGHIEMCAAVSAPVPTHNTAQDTGGRHALNVALCRAVHHFVTVCRYDPQTCKETKRRLLHTWPRDESGNGGIDEARVFEAFSNEYKKNMAVYY